MSQNHHCLQCGTKMRIELIEARPREVCPSCGWIYYLHLRIGAGTVITRAEKLLLAKRAQSPWADTWNLPAGFCEADEHPEQTAERETLEETGLEVKLDGLFGLYYFDDDPRGNGLVVLYNAEITSGELKLNSENSELQFYSKENIPEELSGGGHTQAIRDWQNQLKQS